MHLSIKNKIYWSFFSLVLLFIVNAVASIVTINNNKKLSESISNVIDPALQNTGNLEDLVVQSKIFTTNWVFLRSDQKDKDALKALQDSEYPNLKSKMNLLFLKINDKQMTDSLSRIYAGFDQLVITEKGIMLLLQKDEDYDDPVKKAEAERSLKTALLPRTLKLISSLDVLVSFAEDMINEKNQALADSSKNLRILISVLGVAIIFIALFLCYYMTHIIIKPIHKIKHIVNDLGKGVIAVINQNSVKDEIGEMITSVNNLSKRLRATATFATEIGNRNFHTYFEPLSQEDTLGMALIAMRDSIKLSDEKFNDAQHIAHIGSWERNIKTDKVTISDEMFNIFDIDPLSFDFSYQSLTSFIQPADKNYVTDISSKNLYMAPVPYECKIITSAGVTKSICVETKVVLGKYGEVEKTFGIVQDITDRKLAEARITAEKELFRLMIENMPDQIYLKDADSRFLLCNMPVANNAGFTAQQDLVGKTDYDFFPEKIAKQFFTAEQELMKSGKPIVNLEESLVDKNTGELRWGLTTKVPLKNSNGDIIGLIGISRDITERKSDEQLLRQSEAILETKNKELEIKNRELEQFAFVASHDLQEPLRTTSSFVSLLQQQYYGRLDDKADSYINYIIQASDRMKILIKDLLDYSHIGNKKELKKIECDVMLSEIIEDLNVAISETNTEITYEPLPVISGFPTEIKQLFQNLIMNAIKFRMKDIDPKIRITVKKMHDYWEFAIKDNGIGIDEKFSEKIFIIFQRLHNRTQYKGSGIGLSHCKKIVELHKGKIWFKSTPGKGSTFYFTISYNHKSETENVINNAFKQ